MIYRILLMVGIIGWFITPAFAQPVFEDMPPEENAQFKEQMKTVKKWKLVEALNLNEEQTAKVFPRINAVDQAEEDHRQQMHRLIRNLENLLQDRKTTEPELRQKIKEIDTAQLEHENRRRELRDKVREALTVEQQAKWTLFEIKFADHVRKIAKDMLRERREGPRDGPGPGPRRPND